MNSDAVAALRQTYQHVFASTGTGAVFLDRNLCLLGYSGGAEAFLALGENNTGCPIADIHYHLGSQAEFMADVRRCADGNERVERLTRLSGGEYILERMLPCANELEELMPRDGPADEAVVGAIVPASAATSGASRGVLITWTDISHVLRIEPGIGRGTDGLDSARQQLVQVLDALPDGALILNADFAIEYINPVLKAAFGDISGQPCRDGLHGDILPCTWCIDQATPAGQPLQKEWTSRSGISYQRFEIPLHNADGSESTLEILRDVSEARDARRRLYEAARVARVGHWEWNLVTRQLIWSDQTFASLGYQPGEVEPSFELFLSHVEPGDRARVQDRVETVLDGGDAYQVEFRFRRTDGTLGVGFASGTLTRSDDGAPIALWGAMQDITSLRESELRFQTAFRASPLAASIARVRDGLLVEVNDRYASAFGWTSADLIGRTVSEVGLWADPGAREAWREEFGRTGSTLDLEAVWVCKSGERRHVSLSAERIELDDEPHVVAFAQDITERKENAARIEFLAHHDPLTHLPNRVLFRDRFEQAKVWCQRSRTKLALLYLDLDHFKHINDTLGHPVGDELLKQVATRVAGALRDTDTISRQGGDEFLIVLGGVQDVESVGRTADKILRALNQPFQMEGHELAATVSIGIALWPEDGLDFDSLLQRADTAMYRAKEAGRNTSRFYTGEMNAQALENLKMRSALHWALDQNEFVLHYQPQVDLASGAVVGVEALLRWQRSDGELVPPGRFIPAAEESGQIVPIGEWVLREACAQAMRWDQAGLPEITMAVNVSAVQFRRGDLLGSVTSALQQSGLDPARLELELTESLLMDHTDTALDAVQRFKALGVCLSIDDFGTGYSSLAYLRRFAVDKLKIDQSFVRDIVNDPEDAAIVRAIISMARALKLRVVAEGVENENVARVLGLYHCHEAQGYHFARPMPQAEATAWLQAHCAKVRGLI